MADIEEAITLEPSVTIAESATLVDRLDLEPAVVIAESATLVDRLDLEPAVVIAESATLVDRLDLEPAVVIAESDALLTPEAVGAVFLYDHSETSYTDYTDEANEDTTDDVPLLPSPVGATDCLYIGSGEQFDYLLINIGTAGTTTFTLTWEYWDGTTWTALTSSELWKSDQLTNFRTAGLRSEEHTSELQSRPHISYAVFCLKKKKN
jgi:hypothetical protein